jgi:hypothetical protein
MLLQVVSSPFAADAIKLLTVQRQKTTRNNAGILITRHLLPSSGPVVDAYPALYPLGSRSGKSCDRFSVAVGTVPATTSQQDGLLAGFWFAARCVPGNGTAKVVFEIPHEVLRGEQR